MKFKKFLKNNAITLVSLVVTIIVLIILAGVSINLTLGKNGIITIAKQVKENTELAKIEEETALNQLYSQLLIATNDSSQITISVEDLKNIITEQVRQELNNISNNLNPVGTVISYITGTEAPEGYLACDGSIYNIADYPNLAESIKNGFGSYNYYGGDGETTFAVPNLQGEFLRGAGTNSHTNQGNGTIVGKHQDATEHFLLTSWRDSETLGNLGIYTPVNVVGEEQKMDSTIGSSQTKLFTAFENQSASEKAPSNYTSRPTNTSVLYCIKY